MISAVLFDADGVIQRPSQDWWSRLTSLVPADADAFVADLMAAEKPSLVGKGDFRDAVAEVLRALELAGLAGGSAGAVALVRRRAGGRSR